MSVTPVTFTQETLYQFLYSWINKVINIDPATNPAIEIIKTQQNGPSFIEPYIAISRASVLTKEGRPGKTSPDDSGNRVLINDFSLKVEVWEVNSDGDFLKGLLESLDVQAIKDLWSASGFAFVMTLSPIQDLTALQDNVWRYEHMVELMINMIETTSENVGTITDVQLSGDIPSPGRPDFDIEIPTVNP